ncbi:MAG: polyhydroxyalkanoate synthesis repressor PhaR, partial [Rickettsiales bacterium]
MNAKSSKDTVVIKKYANRRLYNTQTSMYITLEDVSKMVKEGVDFEVRDAKTSEDLTRQILTQIIVEQELSGQNVLSVNFLKRIINLYDDNLREFVPHYLEQSIEGFVENQEKIRQYMDETWKQYNPMNQLEEFGRQNMEILSQTMK